MADTGFTATLVTLCRQSLSGDRTAIRAAEDNLKALLQPSNTEIKHRLAALFRIILVPAPLITQLASVTDDELKNVSGELQLWVAICLKNFVRTHFDASEEHGGLSDDVRRFVRCFLVVAVLNKDRLHLDRNINRQLEETLNMLAEDDFPYQLDYVLVFIQYCHLSDISPEAVTLAFTQRLQKAASMRSQVNVEHLGNDSESLARSLEQAKNTMHLAYAEGCAKQLSAYAVVQQALAGYHTSVGAGDVGVIYRAYIELYQKLMLGIEAICDCLKGTTLNDLDLNKFLQAASVMFPKEAVCNHVVQQNGTVDAICDKGDPLVYLDDRKLYTEDVWSRYTQVATGNNIPQVGTLGHWVTFAPGTVNSGTPVDTTYFKTKAHVLTVFKKLMKKYKTSIYSDGTLRELKIVLTITENMILYVYKYMLAKLQEYLTLVGGDTAATKTGHGNITTGVLGGVDINTTTGIILDLLESITSITKILTYIHAVDLPECCEDNAVVYLGNMLELLKFSHPLILQRDQSGTVTKMKVAITKLMRYYAERYQEVFRPFVFKCIDDMVTLCRGLTQQSEDDDLCSGILDFLTAAAATHWAPHDNRSSPFTNGDYLADVIQAIVVPNIGFRECDLFLLEDCPLEFVQRELDTGTGHSRRFAAINFLKKLVNTYGQMVQHILNQFAQNVSSANDYKWKELYLQLIICANFKVNTRTMELTISQITEGFNLYNYFVQHLKQDLLQESQNLQETQDNVLIVMAILKFVFTFKKQFPHSEMASLVAPIANFLRHPNEAVRYLAAETLNRIAPLVREHKEQLKPCMLQALEILLQHMRQEAPNEFYVRCVMRIFQFLRQDVITGGYVMLDIIVELIKRACDNPVNPVYNHYLFECLALLLKIYLEAGSTDALSRIENGLIPTIAIIIQQEMHPFVPYGLQILYVLLRASQQPGPTYLQLLSHLCTVDTWKESTANAQGAAKLLTCYFERHIMFEQELMASMERILSIFHFCLTHRKLSLVALDILNGILRHLPVGYYAKFLGSIVTVVLTFIHNMRLSDCVPRVVTSLALLATCLHMQKHSTGLVDILESIQAGITQQFLQAVYIPNARKVLALESKRVLVVGTAIIMGSPVVHQSGLFPLLVEFLAELLQGQTLRVAPPAGDTEEDAMEDLEFDVSYVRLRSVDGQDRGCGKLLDPSINVEQVVRGVLSPLGSLLGQLPSSRSTQALINLLNA
ncbi:importin-beta N-terminal domain-containing protein [Babesia ovis]|uniref:Importin-beta N-terminal domain-containing protein n=1 Tax=Babesia ovis TaxID=5869 RepID=A0A9W5TB49_BABOV|nr:importin-beta N-terminal domain-containing protein [Babesia ovis]